MSDAVEKLFTVYSNVHQMLEDREYVDVVSGKWVKTLEEFKAEYVKMGTIDKQSMNFVRWNSKKARHQHPFIYVHFSSEESIGIKNLTDITDLVLQMRMGRCIIIYPDKITPSARKHVEKKRNMKVEVFCEEDLLVNITKHRLMPPHKVLEDSEKALFLKNSNITEEQLPIIKITDRVARYYGMQRGDLVRIKRKSDTAGHYYTYRLCN